MQTKSRTGTQTGTLELISITKEAFQPFQEFTPESIGSKF